LQPRRKKKPYVFSRLKPTKNELRKQLLYGVVPRPMGSRSLERGKEELGLRAKDTFDYPVGRFIRTWLMAAGRRLEGREAAPLWVWPRRATTTFSLPGFQCYGTGVRDSRARW
jgi:hypothetical protein